jgi:Fibronectin type III domain
MAGAGGSTAGAGGATAGAGGTTAGAGGTMAGAGGTMAGAGGTMAGAGGTMAGAGGTTAGAGGTTAGAGGTTAGAGGTMAGAGGTMAGAGGTMAGAGGTMAGAGGTTAGAGGTMAGAGGTMAGAGGGAPTLPAAPTSLVAQVLSTTSIKLTWTDNATDETGYSIYWSTSATKPTTPNATIAAGTNAATAEGLTTGTVYTFWVEAYNVAGSSTAISGTAAAGPVPDQSTGFLVGGTATQLTLNWNDVTAETGYRVYISTTNTQPATPAHELAADAVSYTSPVAEITPLTTY